MLDETIITETPPLYSCYGHIGEQVRVPITGNRSKRILHGAIDVATGDVSLLITKEWTKEMHQGFLSMIRSRWRGIGKEVAQPVDAPVDSGRERPQTGCFDIRNK